MADVDDYFDQLEAALKAREKVVPATPVRAPEPSLVAEAFAALLALEEGEPGAKPVRLVMDTADPRLTDAFLDEVARRVAERLKGE
jgi:hypothetical protein